jgi:hypothetical protein
MLNAAFGDECLSHAHTFVWFKEGWTWVNDNPDPGNHQQAEVMILWLVYKN